MKRYRILSRRNILIIGVAVLVFVVLISIAPW